MRHIWKFGVGIAFLTLAVTAAEAQQQPLQLIRYGFASSAISPVVINIVLPQALGFYQQDGLTVDAIPLGSNATVIASLAAGRIEFGVGVAQYQLALLARGEHLDLINVLEFAYPFKYGVAVNPGSPVQKLSDFRGKRLGVGSLGNSEFPVGQAVFRLIGIDPAKDVSWLAVGENARAGEALRRGDVDGLFYFDTGFGAIEAAGIPLRYLPVPANVPKVGGQYAATTPTFLRDHRAWVAAFARDIIKASIFTQENPEAAAYAFIKLYPEAAPKGKSIEDQVKAIMVPIIKRAPLFDNYDKSVKQRGYINATEWKDEIDFAGLDGKIADPSVLYTNDVIAAANDFDIEKIKAMARNYDLPYKRK